MKRMLSWAAGLVLALSLSVTALAGILWVLGTSETIMLPMMRHFAPSEATGLPDEEYPAMVEMMTGYLAGEVDHFQHWYMIYDVMYGFGDTERAHMADCRALFMLDRTVLIVAGALSLALLIAAILQRNRRVWKGAAIGLSAVMGLVALVAIVAVVDFDRLFILFHHLAFTNDLWLLNPKTDLLIRLMPTDFFMAYAAILGVSWLLFMALMLILSVILYKRGKKA